MLSGRHCGVCGYRFTVVEITGVREDVPQPVICPTCGAAPDRWVARLLTESEPLLQDAMALATPWFHATQRGDWLQNLRIQPFIVAHVGSEHAALERLLQSSEWDKYVPGPWFLHEIRLDPGTKLDPILHSDDEVYWQENSANLNISIHKRYGAARYVNAYEDIGRISLVVDPAHLRITRTQSLTPESAFARLATLVY